MSHSGTSWSRALCWLLYVLAVFSSVAALKTKSHHHNSSVHDNEPDEAAEIAQINALLGSSFQAKWFTGLSNKIIKDVTKFPEQDGAFDPNTAVDSLIDLLKKESKDQEEPLDECFFETLEELKSDPDFIRVGQELIEGLNGERNILTLGADLPELQQENHRIKEVGLRGDVLTGENTDTENDLIRYSSYISGAGSTFGGFLTGFPQSDSEFISGVVDVMNFKETLTEHRLQKAKTLEALRKLEMEIVIDNSIDTETDLRSKRTGVQDVQKTVIDESFDNIKDVNKVSGETKLTQQSFNTQKKVSQVKSRHLGKKRALKFLSKLGKGVETSTTAFNFAQGGVDVAAGSDIIDKAEALKNSGKLSPEEYDTMMRDGQLRVAQGTFGLATGVKDVTTFIGNRFKTKIARLVLSKPTKIADKILRQSVRFAPVVGSMIAMGTAATSMAKNVIAAHDAFEAGNPGKGIMYSVIAAIDGVTLILDGASLVTDFVFPPLSPILDLIGTVLQVINAVLGFFADLWDFRSTKQRVIDELNAYVESDAFSEYLNGLAETYKNRGFDVFTYIVDAEGAGIEADTATLRQVSKDINKCLTDKAKEDFNNPQLRIALLDTTSTGKKLKGRLNNDEIVAGFGPDEIYGCEGDDILFGRGGDDTIYGGPGNDYLNGGTGRDILLGGPGDDVVNCEPAVDKECKGGEGDDTLELSGESLIYDEQYFKDPYITMGKQWEINPNEVSPVKGIYLDMRHAENGKMQGISGISLGCLFQGYPDGLDRSIHKPAMARGSSAETDFIGYAAVSLKSFPLTNWRDELKDKLLWLIVDSDDQKILYDGNNMYTVYRSNSMVARCQSCFQSLETGFAVYELGNDRLKYARGGGFSGGYQKFKALLTFAFKRSFLSDKFEKVAGSPPVDLSSPSNYIPTTIIGDNEDNVIDLSYGLGDVVYTNEGNNVVSVGTTIPKYQVMANGFPDGGFKFAKYIVGGSGENSLILQFMDTSQSCPLSFQFYQNWAILDLDVKLTSVQNDKLWKPHLVYAKNIKTIEVHPPPRSCPSSFVSIFANHYSGGSHFILDKITQFEGPEKSDNDVVLLLRSVRKTIKIKFGVDTINTISFKFYGDSGYKVTKIDIGKGVAPDYGSIHAEGDRQSILENARNVIGTSSCKEIIGNDMANLLMAVGGETTIDAKDGDDTLVSGRGRHVLNGGKGADTYVINGPAMRDVLTISVIMGDDGKTITCQTTIYGEWKSAEKRLEIDLLQDDHADVVFSSVQIIPAEGDENKNLGSLTIDNAKRKLFFEPGNNFNDLKRNHAKVLRVSFTTTGNTATINEEDYGNVVRFESISSFGELKVSIANDKLLFKDGSDNIVLIDQNWKRIEHRTNLLDHILDFAQRFPSMIFRTSDSEFKRYSEKEIVRHLYEQLKHIESELGQDYDSYIDSTQLSSSVVDEIYVGNGANIVLAKTKGKTYRLGSHSSNSIIFANKFVEGSGNVVVRVRGKLPTPRPINTVVVGLGTGGKVVLQKMHHNIIITGANRDEVSFFKCDKRLNYICAKHSKQQKPSTFLVWRDKSHCYKLIFKRDDNVEIIMNCQSYLDSKANENPSTPVWPIIVSYGAEKEYKLTLPMTKAESSIDILGDSDASFISVYFKKADNTDGTFWSDYPYLLIPADDPIPTEINTKMLVNALRNRFRGGIEFSDGEHITNDGICQLVVDLVQKQPPSRFTLTNQNLQCP